MKIKCPIRIRWCVAILFVFINQLVYAQDKQKDDLNLYTGVSSVILPKDDTEVNVVNSLNSFWLAINEYDAPIDAVRIVDRKRYTRTDHSLLISHGFSSSNRWDLGASLNYTRVRLDEAARSSPFRVFGDGQPADGTTYSGITGIGLQVRVVPFVRLQELTLRGGMVFPVAKSDELKSFLNAQRSQLYLTGTYFRRLGPSTLAFLQGDMRFYLRNELNGRSLMVPAAAGYLVFELPRKRWFIFPGLSYGLAFQQYEQGSPFRKSSQQLFGSLGILYQPSTLFSVLLSGQIPFIFDSGSSRSIWVRESYTGINLGFRFIL